MFFALASPGAIKSFGEAAFFSESLGLGGNLAVEEVAAKVKQGRRKAAFPLVASFPRSRVTKRTLVITKKGEPANRFPL
jgi:hypothetical protein